jgi:glucose/mannose-6-phosphate isomerase
MNVSKNSSPLSLDTIGMWTLTASLPEQMSAAIDTAHGVEGLERFGAISSVVVLGMGGSGIAGDVLATIGAPEMAVPVVISKSYELPRFVGPDTLVITVSCSGNTEETLSALSSAQEAGAQILAVTSGGKLGAFAAQASAPIVPVPSDIPQPRAALAAMSVPPLVVLERLGLLEGITPRLRNCVEVISRRRDQVASADGLSAQIARRLVHTIPLIHGASGPSAVAAQRWKAQINENAKAPATFALHPELCHNEVAGWGVNGDVTRQAISLVTLRHSGEHPQVARRFELVAQMMNEVVSHIEEVRTEASEDIARLFDLVVIGDFVSLFLADHDGVDPGPVSALVELKEALARP